eukprot:g9166.t1
MRYLGRSQTAPETQLGREKLDTTLEDDEPEVAEDSHMTLKDYFDAADQRREKERHKRMQRSQITSAGRSQADSSRRSPRYSWRRPQLSAEEIAQNHDEYRKTIRNMLIEPQLPHLLRSSKSGDMEDDRATRAKKAFKRLDLNGSGKISLQEFADGVARIGINWQEMTGMTRTRNIHACMWICMHTSNADRCRYFSFIVHLLQEPERVSTPEFWKRWVMKNRDLEKPRECKWQPTTPEAELHELRKWMASTIHRLKNRGKSDARCREIVAAHLPRGTGPKDLEDVHTFSSAEVKLCKKNYNDEEHWSGVNDPVRNIQKVVYDMREQRRQLHDSRQKLWSLTMEPVMRQQIQDDRKSMAAAVGLSLGGGGSSAKEKEGDAPSQAQARKSIKAIAHQCKMDEDSGFQRLLRSLCPGRTISESDSNYWWEQAVKTMPAPEEHARKAQACDFEHFVQWQHQIRAHLAFHGHPLVGDTQYGGRAPNWCRRSFLHSFRVDLNVGGPLAAVCPLPEDLQNALDMLERTPPRRSPLRRPSPRRSRSRDGREGRSPGRGDDGRGKLGETDASNDGKLGATQGDTKNEGSGILTADVLAEAAKRAALARANAIKTLHASRDRACVFFLQGHCKLYSKCTNFHPSDEAEKQRSVVAEKRREPDGLMITLPRSVC